MGTLALLLLAAIGLQRLSSVAAPTASWQEFAGSLGVELQQSQVAFCRALAILRDPSTTKVNLTLQEWAKSRKALGDAILVDVGVLAGKLPEESSLRAYAVDPSKVAELTAGGTFLEYKP